MNPNANSHRINTKASNRLNNFIFNIYFTLEFKKQNNIIKPRPTYFYVWMNKLFAGMNNVLEWFTLVRSYGLLIAKSIIICAEQWQSSVVFLRTVWCRSTQLLHDHVFGRNFLTCAQRETTLMKSLSKWMGSWFIYLHFSQRANYLY